MLHSISELDIEKNALFEERQHVMAIGNFMHKPNIDALCYLKDSIWPIVKKKNPDIELHIYGAYSSEQHIRFHDIRNRFFIKGFTSNVNTIMQTYRINLAALRFGAGLKGKLFDAMQNGLPSICTSIASEGVFGDFDIRNFNADNAEDFACKIVTLYKNKALWERIQILGFETINKRFNKRVHQDRLMQRIRKITDVLDTHRLNNFTGLMLFHHQLQSTKFMSKWIEEKNANLKL